MESFKFDVYDNSRSTAQIADLMTRGPEARARALELAAQARARASEIGGQGWSNAIQGIGQSVAGTIGDVIKQREEAPFRQAQLTDLQLRNQMNQNTVTAQAQTQRAQQLLPQLLTQYTDPATKKTDFRAVGQALAQVDPAFSTKWLSTAADTAKDFDTLDQADRAREDAQWKVVGGLAAKATDLDGFHTLIGMLSPSRVDPALKQHVLSMADQAGPDQWPQVVEAIRNMIPAQPMKLGKDEIVTDLNNPSGPPLASNMVPEKPPAPSAASLAADAANPASPTAAQSKAALTSLQAGTQATAAETARHNQELERIASLSAGRMEAAQRETARHDQAMEVTAAKAADPLGLGAQSGAAGPAGPAGPKGDEFLKTIPPALQAQVKALAEGRQPFPTGMSYAKLQPLIGLVSQYDPTFDAANYNARNKARTDLTSPSGTGGKTINAINTALQHAGKLSDLIEQLDNYESPIANAVANPLRNMAGSTKVTNFNAVAPQLMKEIERAWRGTGGSASEIQDLIKSIGPNLGKQQQREALAQFVELLKGKLDSTQQQRDNIMGPAAGSIPILFEQNQPVIEKIAQRAGGQTAQAAPAPGMMLARDPQGQLHQAKPGTPLPTGWTLEGPK